MPFVPIAGFHAVVTQSIPTSIASTGSNVVGPVLGERLLIGIPKDAPWMMSCAKN